jgi:hypothetical protein
MESIVSILFPVADWSWGVESRGSVGMVLGGANQ